MVEVKNSSGSPLPNFTDYSSSDFEVETSIFSDSRGEFENVIPRFFAQADENIIVNQVNISRNLKSGTIRGLHFQEKPFAEYKVVKCIKGAAFDVVVDIRPSSISFGKWISFTIDARSASILIPPGFAHGFQTLEDHSEMLYLHSNIYSAKHSSGVNPMDPKLGVAWPLPVSVISEADTKLKNLEDLQL